MNKLLFIILIPLLYFLFIPIAVFTKTEYGFGNIPLAFMGVAITYIGLFFWIGGMISLGNSFGVLPEKKKRVKRGLYKYFDHPIYVGIYLTFLGLSIALGSLPGFLYDLVIMIPLSYYRAKKEEKLLHD